MHRCLLSSRRGRPHSHASAMLPSTLESVCGHCLHPLGSVECTCARWRISEQVGFGRVILTRHSLEPGNVILTDGTGITVQLTGAPCDDDGTSGESSPPAVIPTVTRDTAPNPAAAAIPILVQLLEHLRSGGPTSDLVRQLHFEPVESLRARDEPNAAFFDATAREFVKAIAGDTATTESDATEAREKSMADARVLVHRLLSAIRLNSFTASSDSGSRSMVLMMIIAAVNHSCAPNAALTGPLLSATRSIPAGAQVFISYLNDRDLALHTEARRAKLFRSWGFHCRCERCGEQGGT